MDTATLVLRNGNQLAIVDPVEDIAAELDGQRIVAIEPLTGWAPYTHLIDAQDDRGEVRSYFVVREDQDDSYFAHRGMICPACETGTEEEDHFCEECGYQLRELVTNFAGKGDDGSYPGEDGPEEEEDN